MFSFQISIYISRSEFKFTRSSCRRDRRNTTRRQIAKYRFTIDCWFVRGWWTTSVFIGFICATNTIGKETKGIANGNEWNSAWIFGLTVKTVKFLATKSARWRSTILQFDGHNCLQAHTVGNCSNQTEDCTDRRWRRNCLGWSSRECSIAATALHTKKLKQGIKIARNAYKKHFFQPFSICCEYLCSSAYWIVSKFISIQVPNL